MTFLIIWLIYLISISQISSKNLQKVILSKNKSYTTNKTISTLLNNTKDEKKSKRKTNSNYPNQNYHNYGYGYNYTNKNNTYNNTKNQTEGMSGLYLLAWFTIFFIIGLYLICEMKKFEKTKNRTGDVWFYLYLSNLGILVVAGVKIFDINNMLVDSSPFGLSSLFFLIMNFYYFCKLIKECGSDKTKIIIMFSNDKVGQWAKLPCFIWSLIGLTDPCCMSTTYTVTTYADGHTESDLWATELWNCFIKVIKRFAYFFSVISFYFGLFFFYFYGFLLK